MILFHPLIFALMLTPAADVAECPAKSLIPLVEVVPVRKDPTFNYAESSLGLTAKGAGAYAPPGSSPSWHKGGLTQSSPTFEQRIEATILKFSNGQACIYVNKIQLTVTSAPNVWVANDFPPGTCMYNAVKDHELKHVHAEQATLATHTGRMKTALENVGKYRTVFGPGTEADVNARYNQLFSEINQVVKNESDVFSLDEARAQQAIDTLAEYNRISNLCASQLRAMQ
jgi:hypothetical protein